MLLDTFSGPCGVNVGIRTISPLSSLCPLPSTSSSFWLDTDSGELFRWRLARSSLIGDLRRKEPLPVKVPLFLGNESPSGLLDCSLEPAAGFFFIGVMLLPDKSGGRVLRSNRRTGSRSYGRGEVVLNLGGGSVCHFDEAFGKLEEGFDELKLEEGKASVRELPLPRSA